jgi:histidine ammonia-lyase
MSQDLDLASAWTLEDLAAISERQVRIIFPAAVRERVAQARHHVCELTQEGAQPIYGINTGFGALAETVIPPEALKELQRNLLRSHACGVGPELPIPVVRVMLALRAQTLALGYSGVRPELIDLLIAMYHHDVLPRIPMQGSVGASGDLAPLAHLGLAVIGEGEVWDKDRWRPSSEALQRVGLVPLELEPKEGLALINGTQFMLAIGALAVHEAESLCQHADVIGAMSLEAQKGSYRPFDERIQQVRPHPGQAITAANLRLLLTDSAIMESHRDCDKVQDPYSLRCMPQVHGATRDVLRWTRDVLEREIGSATDNPLVFVSADGVPEVISGGNFHGQPLALAMDAACMAVAELANISERRVEQLVNPALSTGLPAFLAPRVGLDSGYMLAQVTAASLVSENKILCHPASTDSIPSSAGREDHVSMGSISARKLATVVSHVRTVLAIEALVAAQGIDLRAPLKPGHGVARAHARLRMHVKTLVQDRPLYTDIHTAIDVLKRGELVDAAFRE